MTEARWRPRVNRVYIVPNRYGFLAFGGVLVIVATGYWYHSPLAYLLGTCLISIVLVAMVQCNTNLKGLSLHWFEADPTPRGGVTIARLTLVNAAKAPRLALDLDVDRPLPRGNSAPVADSGSIQRAHAVLPHAGTILEARFPAAERGIHAPPRIRISSVFPLGLFYAWQWQYPPGEYVVYPEPLGDGSRAPSVAQQESIPTPKALVAAGSERTEFHAHRLFRRGDSLAAVDWKAKARGRPLLVKEFHAGSQPTRELTWDDAVTAAAGARSSGADGPLRVEAILSQLSAWVLQMGTAAAFTLVLPNVRSGPGAGERHVAHCLRLLAAVTHDP